MEGVIPKHLAGNFERSMKLVIRLAINKFIKKRVEEDNIIIQNANLQRIQKIENNNEIQKR